MRGVVTLVLGCWWWAEGSLLVADGHEEVAAGAVFEFGDVFEFDLGDAAVSDLGDGGVEGGGEVHGQAAGW
jgi:hypothetical protein